MEIHNLPGAGSVNSLTSQERFELENLRATVAILEKKLRDYQMQEDDTTTANMRAKKAEEKLEKIQENIQRLTFENRDLRERVKELEEEVSAQLANIEKLKEKKHEEHVDVNQIKGDNASLQNKIKLLNAQIDSLNNKLNKSTDDLQF